MSRDHPTAARRCVSARPPGAEDGKTPPSLPRDVDVQADRETLIRLLAQGTESAKLDYKAQLDLDDKQHLVELVKDIAAMSALGGHIVIGSTEQGSPTGLLNARSRKLLDEAALRPKIARYVGAQLSLATAWHDVQGHGVALVAVQPHPVGVCVLQRDGVHGDQPPVFRAGDVYIRRGTSSVRWSEQEAIDLLARMRAGQRDSVRQELTEDLTAMMRQVQTTAGLAAAPTAALSWELDIETFVDVVLEQLRNTDDLPVRRLLLSIPRKLAELAQDIGGIARTADLLDHVSALLAALLLFGYDVYGDEVLRRLSAAWERAGDAPRPGSAVPADLLGVMQAERMWPVGALAVREERWDVVRKLATVRVSQPGSRLFWLTETQRHAERSGVLAGYAQQAGHTSLLTLAEDLVGRLPLLSPDLLPGDRTLMTSLCRFDFLQSLVIMDSSARADAKMVLGNFAGWYSDRLDPLVVQLLDDDSMLRRTMYPRPDAELARALVIIQEAAVRRWGLLSAPWDGYEDQRIVAFIEQHVRS